MSEDEVKSQLEGMQKLVDLAKQRTQMSGQRTYLNTERTLSVWIRTALAAMVFGIAIDRLGLMFYKLPSTVTEHTLSNPNNLTKIIGVLLIIFSMLMALSSGIRFLIFTKKYKSEFTLPAYHSATLPIVYALMIVIFGALLLVLTLCIN